MEEKGLKVVALYPESIAELYEAMCLQGKLFGKEKKVEYCIDRMNKMFAFIRERCRKVPSHTSRKRKKVIWLGGKQTTVSGVKGINNDLIGLTGGVNPGAVLKEQQPRCFHGAGRGLESGCNLHLGRKEV